MRTDERDGVLRALLGAVAGRPEKRRPVFAADEVLRADKRPVFDGEAT